VLFYKKLLVALQKDLGNDKLFYKGLLHCVQ